MDFSTPNTGNWFLDHIAPGYTPGQRVAGFFGRMIGGPLGGLLIGKGLNAWDNAHNPHNQNAGFGGQIGTTGSYGGGFMGGSTSNSGFSLDTPNYGGQMPGQSTFGTGYGSGNLFNTNSYNVDAFGLPTDPTQVGPFGNTQSAPGGVGNSAASGGHGANTAPPSPVYMFNNGARAGWGSTNGPNYT